MLEKKSAILDNMPDLLDEHQVAKVLNIAEQTLRKWRCNRSGPEYLKLNGTMVRYRKGAVADFIQSSEKSAGEML